MNNPAVLDMAPAAGGGDPVPLPQLFEGASGPSQRLTDRSVIEPQKPAGDDLDAWLPQLDPTGLRSDPDHAGVDLPHAVNLIEPAVEPAVEPKPEPETGAPKRIRRFSLIDPEQRWVMVAAILGLGGILAASLGSSFTSVYAMAAWVGLPSAVQFLPVVILDVAIVGFSWALMVFKSRQGDRVWTTRLWLSLVTSFSVAANFMHTYDFWSGNLNTPQAIMGAAFSASIPLMSLWCCRE